LALLGLTRSFPAAAGYLCEYGAEIIMIKGATPIPFKLLTITAGFISMPLLTFIGASLVSRAISFMIVGVLFRLFGAPIKAFIDKYLGLATAGFVILVVGGFIAASMLTGGGVRPVGAECSAVVAKLQQN
jgi:membrane protein DedA with SNARE-associated domain